MTFKLPSVAFCVHSAAVIKWYSHCYSAAVAIQSVAVSCGNCSPQPFHDSQHAWPQANLGPKLFATLRATIPSLAKRQSGNLDMATGAHVQGYGQGHAPRKRVFFGNVSGDMDDACFKGIATDITGRAIAYCKRNDPCPSMGPLGQTLEILCLCFAHIMASIVYRSSDGACGLIIPNCNCPAHEVGASPL